jgi:hypothetical protein
MVKIKMQDHSPIFINTTTPQDFIKGGVDLSEANRAASNETLAILISFGAELR